MKSFKLRNVENILRALDRILPPPGSPTFEISTRRGDPVSALVDIRTTMGQWIKRYTYLAQMIGITRLENEILAIERCITRRGRVFYIEAQNLQTIRMRMRSTAQVIYEIKRDIDTQVGLLRSLK